MIYQIDPTGRATRRALNLEDAFSPTPILVTASFTSSNLKGCMIASIFFIRSCQFQRVQKRRCGLSGKSRVRCSETDASSGLSDGLIGGSTRIPVGRFRWLEPSTL